MDAARVFCASDRAEEEFRLALKSEGQAEIPLLKRFNNIFETLISLAPLLGLLGTILGLIASFASLNIGDVDRNYHHQKLSRPEVRAISIELFRNNLQ